MIFLFCFFFFTLLIVFTNSGGNFHPQACARAGHTKNSRLFSRLLLSTNTLYYLPRIVISGVLGTVGLQGVEIGPTH